MGIGTLTERLLAGTCVCGLVTVIAAYDDRVRQLLLGLLRLEPSAVLSVITGRTAQIIQATTTISGEYTPLVLFAIGGIVLLGLMLRA